MNTQTHDSRLTALLNANKQTLHLIHRLSRFPSQPGVSSQHPDVEDPRIELGAEIHQSLKNQEEEFELLRQEIEDQANASSWTASARRRESERDRERTSLAAQVTRVGEDLRS